MEPLLLSLELKVDDDKGDRYDDDEERYVSLP